MKALLAALAMSLTVSAGAAAQDDALPDAVATPFLAYEAAMEAQDWDGAVTAAGEAYRAGAAARLDADLVAILAENYANLTLRLGRYEEAQTAWREAAGHSQRARLGSALVAEAHHKAALAGFARGDLQGARRDSDRAMTALDRSPQRGRGAGVEAIPPELAGDIIFLAAHIRAQSGRLRAMRTLPRRALEALEAASRQGEAVYGNAAYLAGVEAFLWGDRAQSAYDFHVSSRVMAALGEGRARDARMAALWSTLAIRDLTERERQALEARIAASPFPRPEPDGADAEASVVDPDAPEDPDNRDARPLQRTPPVYPANALQAGLEGIVLIKLTVSETGIPEDVEIIAAAPPNLFDQAVLDAVSQWRYEPRLVNGAPTRREGVLTHLYFEMCDPGDRRCR